MPRTGPAKTFVRPRLEHPSVPDHGAPQPESDLVGTRIGLYEIAREVGRGGMGTVYEARCMDGSFRKRVAIRIASASFLSTQSQGFALHRRESKDVSSKREPGMAKRV